MAMPANATAMDSSSTAAQVDRNLRELRDGFLERLSERCLEIETLLQMIARDGALDHLRVEIAQRAHKTAGVAPTFGFEQLGALAGTVEALWTSNFRPEAIEECVATTEAFLDEIERVLDVHFASEQC